MKQIIFGGTRHFLKFISVNILKNSEFLGKLDDLQINFVNLNKIQEHGQNSDVIIVGCCSKHVKGISADNIILDFCLNLNLISEVLSKSGNHSSFLKCTISVTYRFRVKNFVTDLSPSNRFSNSLKKMRIRKLRMAILEILGANSIMHESKSLTEYRERFKLDLVFWYFIRRLVRIPRKIGLRKDSNWAILLQNDKLSILDFLISKYENYADPFLFIDSKNDVYVFHEKWRNNQKGVINCAKYDIITRSWHEYGTVLEEDFHLSFPFLFEYHGELFMLPQSATQNRIRIYKCVEFPITWSLVNEIEIPMQLVDCVCIYTGEKWLMTGSAKDPDFQYLANLLYVFETADIFSTKYIQEFKSARLWSDDGGRNGGFFKLSGLMNFCRVGQVAGSDRYGNSVSFELMTLNSDGEFDYMDHKLRINNNGYSIHHVDYEKNSDWLVFDFRKLY